MARKDSENQKKSMSKLFRGRAIFKPLNTGRIDERVACVREWIANIFFYTKNGVTIMIDAGYNYERLKEKMGWLYVPWKSWRKISGHGRSRSVSSPAIPAGRMTWTSPSAIGQRSANLSQRSIPTRKRLMTATLRMMTLRRKPGPSSLRKRGKRDEVCGNAGWHVAAVCRLFQKTTEFCLQL
jgi:hypothetical protein